MAEPLNPYQFNKPAATGPIDPYSGDETPLVSVTINGVESDYIASYCYDSDILQLGDPFSVVLPDPHNRFKSVVEGQSISLNMASPQVGGGQKLTKIKGIVTQVIREITREGGNILNVAGADLGWHLVNNDAPIWKRLAGRTFGGLYDLFVDSSWGFAGFQVGNDRNVKVKMGGNYARSVATLGDQDKPPIVQVEPGDKPADYFIQYAKLANKLVNVSHDGFLQLFTPRYDTPIAYTFYNYSDDVRGRGKNNIERARLTRKLDTRYTKAVCVGTRLLPETQAVDPNNPNTNSFRGTYTRPVGVLAAGYQAGLPFTRLSAFADADRLSKAQAAARAKWKVQRGDFDAWLYEITVKGHSQGGNFFEPDTMCEVYDDYCGLAGKFYVSAVRYDRSRDHGVTTTLQIRLPGLLAA